MARAAGCRLRRVAARRWNLAFGDLGVGGDLARSFHESQAKSSPLHPLTAPHRNPIPETRRTTMSSSDAPASTTKLAGAPPPVLPPSPVETMKAERARSQGIFDLRRMQFAMGNGEQGEQSSVEPCPWIDHLFERDDCDFRRPSTGISLSLSILAY